MHRWIVPTLVAMLAAGAAHAANDKGQDKSGDKDESARGQVVSECNHRANDKNLKGQERKDYVEWCESRGARYGYRDGDYDRERDCYRRAFDRNLSGEKRQSFLKGCLEESERKHEGSKSRDKDGKSDGGSLDAAGRDVLGKGKEKK